MSTRCSANQIADYVVTWGISKTFPKYREYVEEEIELKNLDLIISTLDIFANAFRFSFEDIYRKYEVDFPLSYENFFQFLKPRCQLLTKDDKCFNFMLVCAFVSEIINSFVHKNKYYYLVEVSSKCLTAILKNRFKRIFETDSGWEELLSFCRKIHSLEYPPEEKCESEDNQLVGEVDESTEKDDYETESGYDFPANNEMYTLFSPKFAELSVEKDRSNTKITDFSTEKHGEKLERLCSLESPSVCATHIFQLKDKEKDIHENTAREGDEKDCATDTLLSDLTEEFTNMAIKATVISNKEEDTEKLGQMVDLQKNLRIPFEGYLAINKEAERVEGLCTFGLASKSASHTFQLKGENSASKEESVDKEKPCHEKSARKDNKKVCEIVDKDETEKFGHMVDLKKNITLPIEDYFAIKKITQKLEDLCTLGLASISASHTLELNKDNCLPEKEAVFKEKTDDRKNARQDDEFCQTNTKDPSSPNSAQEVVKAASNKSDQDTVKPGQFVGLKMRLSVSLGKDFDAKKTPEKVNLFNIESTSSAGTSETLQQKGEDMSIFAELVDEVKIVDESEAIDGNEKYYVPNSLPSDLPHELAKMSVEKDAFNDNVEGAEKNGWEISHRTKVTLSARKDSVVEKAREKSVDLFNLMAGSSTDALLLEDVESASKNESEDIEPLDIHSMPADKIRSRITDNPQHLSEIMNLLKNCEEDIDPNLFPPDEYDISSDDDEELDL